MNSALRHGLAATLAAGFLATALSAQSNTFPASGNVGIGTTTPVVPLDVKIATNWHFGAFYNTPNAMSIGAFSDGFAGWQPLSINPGGQVWFLGGNVGIGTSAPAAKLDVAFTHGKYTRHVLPAAANGAGTGEAGLYTWISEPGWSWTGAGIGRNIYNSGTWGARVNSSLSAQMVQFREDPTIAFSIWDAAGTGYQPLSLTKNNAYFPGNVGIGIATPVAKLHLSSSASGFLPMLYGHGTLPQWPTTLLNVSGENATNVSGAMIGLNLENASRTNGTFSPFLTFSRKSETGAYNPAIAGIAGLDTGAGPDANWRAGALTFWTAGASQYGVMERVRIDQSGNVGIGTTNPTNKLEVAGTIRAKEVIVETTGWSDYVFAPDYRLAPLAEVEAHIAAKGTLPGIPSAAEVATQGVSVGDMQAKLLAKIEELTLRQIAQEKEIQRLRAEVATLRNDQL